VLILLGFWKNWKSKHRASVLPSCYSFSSSSLDKKKYHYIQKCNGFYCNTNWN